VLLPRLICFMTIGQVKEAYGATKDEEQNNMNKDEPKIWTFRMLLDAAAQKEIREFHEALDAAEHNNVLVVSTPPSEYLDD
jgi:hypothetical protein